VTPGSTQHHVPSTSVRAADVVPRRGLLRSIAVPVLLFSCVAVCSLAAIRTQQILAAQLQPTETSDVARSPWFLPTDASAWYTAVGAVGLASHPLVLVVVLLAFARNGTGADTTLCVPRGDDAGTGLSARWRDAVRAELRLEETAPLFAVLFGALSSIPMVLAIARVIEVAVLRTRFSAVDVTGYVTPVVAGVAIGVGFGLELAVLVSRASRADLTARTFSEACGRMVRILLSTTVVVVVVEAADIAIPGPAEGAALGAAIGVLGNHIVRMMTQGAAMVVGTSDEDPEDLLVHVEGLSHLDRERLNQEGVTSAHALAYASTPRLYLATPFTWRQICDWQAQALMLVYCGAERHSVWRRAGLRSALDLGDPENIPTVLDDRERGVLAALERDPTRKDLGAWSRCFPIGDDAAVPDDGKHVAIRAA
jgi:hypothetical protein